MHRNTGNTEPVIVEYGFLDSTKDDVQQIKNNWQEYAEAVVRAIAEYMDLPYQTEKNGTYYTVSSGDSLWGIAKKFGVTVDELKTINNLSSNLLSIGQILKIPQLEETNQIISYTVKSGDTLYNIADQYNTTVSELMNLNGLTTNLLSIGQILKIPVSDSIITNDNNENILGTYIVKSGDTLYNIANKYNTTVSELKNINNLSDNILTIGQILNLPNSSNINTYTVVSGDTLYNIANRYNTTVSDLINKNNLTSNSLKIGQVLKL